MKIEKLTKIKTEYATISPDNFQLMEKINEIIDVINSITEQPKEEVDGFDAELNALLKKYEYLPKEELAECLEFYLGVVNKSEAEMVDANETNGKHQDIMKMLQSIYEVLVSINNRPQILCYEPPSTTEPHYVTEIVNCNKSKDEESETSM